MMLFTVCAIWLSDTISAWFCALPLHYLCIDLHYFACWLHNCGCTISNYLARFGTILALWTTNRRINPTSGQVGATCRWWQVALLVFDDYWAAIIGHQGIDMSVQRAAFRRHVAPPAYTDYQESTNGHYCPRNARVNVNAELYIMKERIFILAIQSNRRS